MSDERNRVSQQADARQGNNENDENELTIGGPTSREMGTEYHIVSSAGREVFDAEQANVPVGHNPEGRMTDAGREPMFYDEKRSPGGTIDESTAIDPSNSSGTGDQSSSGA